MSRLCNLYSAALIGVMTLAAGISCQAQGNPPAPGQTPRAPAAPGDVAGPIAVRVTTDKKTYAPTDSIKLTMTVRNTTKAPISLAFSSGQKYDFEIRSGAKIDSPLVWRWSRGMMFTMNLSTIQLAAGKALSFTETFVPKGKGAKAADVALKAGTYMAVGTLTIMPRTARPFGTVTFVVK